MAEFTRLGDPVLYSIWRIRHGYPLYEPPTEPFFAVTFYNFLFYRSYAWIFDLFRVSDSLTPLAGRFISAAFALAGALLQYAAGRDVMSRCGRREWPLPALLAVLCWGG